MPIVRIKGLRFPYYITINELLQLKVSERIIMYKDDPKRKSLQKQDIDEIIEYILKKYTYKPNTSFPYSDFYFEFSGNEARCATTELVMYYVYFFCKHTSIIASNLGYYSISRSISLNNFLYPYSYDEIDAQGLFLKSGVIEIGVHLFDIQNINGYFNNFVVNLNDVAIFFSLGKIYFETKRTNEIKRIDKFCMSTEEIKPFVRYFNSIDKKNYRKFALYLNENSLYANFDNPRLYKNIDSYRIMNPDL